MTACRNKARGAVVAALAGALTLGAAPVMALADGAGLMAVDANNIGGGTIAYKSGQSGDSFTYNGEAQGLVPTTLTPVAGDALDLTLLPSDYSSSDEDINFYLYVKIGDTDAGYADLGIEYKDADGKTQALKGTAFLSDGKYAMPSEPGEYAVVAGVYDHEAKQLTYSKNAGFFTISGKSLAGATLYQVNPKDENDLSDTTFDYTGVTGCRNVVDFVKTLGVSIDGEKVDGADIKIYTVGGSELGEKSYLECGTEYVALVTAKNYSGNAQLRFTYEKLSLTTADVVTKVITGDAAPSAATPLTDLVESVNNIDVVGSNFSRQLKVDFVSDPDGNPTSVNNTKGEYTFKVAPKDDEAKKYIDGEATIKVVYADQAAVISFDDCNDSVSAGSATVDLSKDKPDYFDLSKITVKDEDDNDIDEFDVVVLDEEGKEVSEDSLEKPGTWTVKVTVDAKNEDGESVVGSATCEVVVSYENVTQDANVYMTYDGKNVEGLVDPTYTGEDLMGNVAVKVVAGSKTLVEGTDYEVTVENAEGDEVDEVVDAGNYTVKVKGLTYSGADATFTVAVQQVELETLVPANPFAVEDVTVPATDGTPASTHKVYYLAHTGEELAPEYTFKDAEGNEWTLAADEYGVNYQKDSKAADLKDEGDYKISSVKIDAKNFEGSDVKLPGDGGVIRVTSNRVFADVPNDEYYTDAVAVAKQQGYVFGMGGTNLFMPNSSISRADMAVILYRMAGGVTSEDWSASQTDTAFLSQYGDVDAKAYYAQALAWATRTGVVSGYEDGNFGPADAVTVEQFVTMLARYAKVVGNYEAVDADAVLGTVADGDQVSEFGQDAVAWAIDNGYLAQGGADIQPQSPVSRARAITIAVRYQPAKASLI